MRRFRLIAIVCWAACVISAQPPDPAEEARRAGELVAGGRAEEAIPIYFRLAQQYPDSPELLLNLCIAEFRAKRYQDTIVHANDALRLNPSLAPANLFLGAAYLELRQYVKAVGPLQKAVDALPGDKNARLMLGEALLGLKRYDEALERFQETARLLPQNPRVWYQLGQAYDGLFDQCRLQLRTMAPDSTYWWALEGDSYLEQRRFGSAVLAYREALRKGPAIPGIHAAIARAYSETGHEDWASEEQALERTIGTPSNTSDAAAARYAKCRSDGELAAQAYAQLMELPPSPESHLHAAKNLDAEGRYLEAASEWKRCLDLAPDNLEAAMGLAWSLYRRRDYDPVLATLKRVLARQPESAEVNFLYGASLLNMEQADAAIPYLRTALKQDPELRAADAALGQALLRTGKADEAIPYLKAAIAGDEDGNAHFQLFRAYQRTGQVELAKQTFAQYRNLRASAAQRRAVEDGSQIPPPGE